MTPRTDAPTRRPQVLAALVAGVLGWTAYVVTSLLGDAYSVPWILALVVFGAGWIAARALSRDIAERPAAQVDEYELVRRHKARDAGYRTALGASLLVFIVLSVGVQLDQRGGGELLASAPYLVLAVFLAAAAVPSFLLALQDDPD